MNLTINGEVKAFQTGIDSTTLEMVLTQLGYHPQTIVVEFNGVIINRQKWALQKVHEGDVIEIVTIVGGGC